jgi:toxin ParE1/3/4
MAELIWSPSALADINNIAEFINHDSPQGAKAQVAAFFDRAQVLETFPKIGRVVPELQDTRYRQILEGRYRLIYQVIENNVHILSVHHQSMLLQNNPIFKNKFKRKKK